MDARRIMDGFFAAGAREHEHLLNLSGITPDSEPETTATHVATWLPSYLVCGGPGFWELRTTSDFAAGDLPLCDDWFTDPPRNIAAPTLAAWIGQTLGFPVVLQEDSQDLRRSRFAGRWTAEPLFWVRRAS